MGRSFLSVVVRMKPYGSRRADNDMHDRSVTRGGKSSRARAKREDDSLKDIDLRDLSRELAASPEHCTKPCCVEASDSPSDEKSK